MAFRNVGKMVMMLSPCVVRARGLLTQHVCLSYLPEPCVFADSSPRPV